MASQGAVWGPAALRLFRVATTKASKALRNRLADVAKPFQGQVQARGGCTGRQPIRSAALFKQHKRTSRWLPTVPARCMNLVIRRYFRSEHTLNTRFDRSKLPSSNTSRRLAQFSGRAPFASTLRPNLTGGAMPRTAGGYSLGGSARYFSHTPAASAQVVQNVSQAVRAFFLSGQKVRYNGAGPHGEHQYRAISKIEDEVMTKLSSSPRPVLGSFIDFRISPIITAVGPLAGSTSAFTFPDFDASPATRPATLDMAGFLDVLFADFQRGLHDLAKTESDIRRLSAVGALRISLERSDRIRVHFPGVGALAVEQLCDEIGIQRGIVGQDAGFDGNVGAHDALKFPFAPEFERTTSPPDGTARSLKGRELDSGETSSEDDLSLRDVFVYEFQYEDSWMSDMEGYESMSPSPTLGEKHYSKDYEGFEGIYRFLEECDQAKGRLR
ncbi:uncharacterized protein UV8b_02101 [Ustilaginoidea virens]|uniref:Uncharacterized protein n=1 Tax=Ustilaginoidea virens TaxID=1159556 RepID=A0A063BND6_USTVR|nr:uncharacterized protein UV8b_02101 [Ustilaginoidea virens]QUC17860.1 hypothetical protein UV8b_02101 [Ustilaginoidea virens]GAO17799.1 hypothetical protein UVI_02049340 [Ustilaginoidea virens]